MVLSGESLDATTAHAWGLVDEIVGDGEAERRALEVAKLWSSRAPLAVGTLKRVFARGQLSHRDALAQEGLDQRTLMGTRDTAEALGAFLEKRRPVFEGR
jgi:enoyl-CoA hydratase/carnithine racemase